MCIYEQTKDARKKKRCDRPSVEHVAKLAQLYSEAAGDYGQAQLAVVAQHAYMYQSHAIEVVRTSSMMIPSMGEVRDGFNIFFA
jgi:hypothetical protein